MSVVSMHNILTHCMVYYIQVLDTCDLAISSVVNAESGGPLQYQLKSDVEGAFGTPLFITLPSSSAVK